MAELERLYGADAVQWFGDSTALIDSPAFDFERLGGTQKAGRVSLELNVRSWNDVSRAIVDAYYEKWNSLDHKVTLGISVYGWNVQPRDVQKAGIILKKKLRETNVSLRLIPNDQAKLSTATSHHNKLGLSPSKVELIVVRHGNRVIVAESIGTQNITALAARDQARPKTDAFVGMLPPKLARMMVNIAAGSVLPLSTAKGSAFPAEREQDDSNLRSRGPAASDGGKTNSLPIILDPFCGTGVVLQEALLLGFDASGTDLSEKMVNYTGQNLEWLSNKWHVDGTYSVEHGDAMTHQWLPPIDAIASEAYLGQPFSAPPSPAKLREVRGNCDHIISSFLENIGRQVASGTTFCLAVPAWNDGHDRFTHLPLTNKLDSFGFTRIELSHASARDLLYYRPGQVVARELLVMKRT